MLDRPAPAAAGAAIRPYFRRRLQVGEDVAATIGPIFDAIVTSATTS